MNSVVLHFGSRSGSWFALGLFTAMFGTLGWGVAREIRLRSKVDSGVARVLGLALLVGPVVMVYASSLNGFYEAPGRESREWAAPSLRRVERADQTFGALDRRAS